MQSYFIQVTELIVTWIFMQHICLLSDFLSEYFVRYIFIHFNPYPAGTESD